MPFLGAHLSIAGGYYRAIDAAAALGMEACQLFTKNNQQWRARPITPAEVAAFRQAFSRSSVQKLLAHASYLINLAASDQRIYRQSVDAMTEEVRRAEALGLNALVVHPGGHGESTAAEGLERVASALDEVHQRCPGARVRILLESTAGQGQSLGHSFEHLQIILQQVRQSERLGVCLDTCHLFAAGHALAPRRAYLATMRQFDKRVGIERVEAFHLNDSAKPFASRVDRHAHIGRGHMGLEPFGLVLNDRRFRRLPMVLETPKGTEGGQDLDAINLETLRSLMPVPGRARRGGGSVRSASRARS